VLAAELAQAVYQKLHAHARTEAAMQYVGRE
jgi:hypothetical protein